MYHRCDIVRCKLNYVLFFWDVLHTSIQYVNGSLCANWVKKIDWSVQKQKQKKQKMEGSLWKWCFILFAAEHFVNGKFRKLSWHTREIHTVCAASATATRRGKRKWHVNVSFSLPAADMMFLGGHGLFGVPAWGVESGAITHFNCKNVRQ